MDQTFTTVASARERQAAILGEIRRLRAKEFPKEVSEKLLRALDEIVEGVGLKLHRYAELPGTPPEMVAALVSPLLPVHDVLAWFDKTDSSRIPHELLEGFERLTGDLLAPKPGEAPDVAFFFVPARDYNYSVVDLHEDLLRRHRELAFLWRPLMELHPHPVQVTFPAAEAGSTLLHTLLYHEIGHLLYRRLLSRSPVLAAAARQLDEAVASLAARVDDHLRRQLDEMGLSAPGAGCSPDYRERYQAVLDRRRASLKSEARRTFLLWIEEVCCDLIALRLAGPAFICAFQFFWDPFLVRTSCDIQHPHWITRSKFLSAYVDHLRDRHEGFKQTCSLFGAHADLTKFAGSPLARGADADGILDGATRDDGTIDDESFAFGIAAQAMTVPGPLFSALIELLEQCRTPFDEADLGTRVSEACAQIAGLAPPLPRDPFIPRSHAQVLAIAFCAAWLFRTRDMQQAWQGPARLGWDEKEGLSVLGQLVLSAVEAGDLELRYRRSRDLDEAPAS